MPEIGASASGESQPPTQGRAALTCGVTYKSLMRYFRHTIAQFICVKHCGYHRSDVEGNWSVFHFGAAVTATVPLWIASLYQQFPWYYVVSLLAGELLLMFGAGFLASLVLLAFRGARRCKQCGAAMVLCGRHFDPAGSAKPDLGDVVVFVFFVGLNVAAWVVLASGGL